MLSWFSSCGHALRGYFQEKKMIRSIVILIAVCAISLPTFAKGGSHSVRGYTKKNGTHVAPSHDTEQSERFGIWFGS